METIEFAIKMEQDGQKFYTQAAETVTDAAAQRMLRSLAQDEKRHQQIIESYQTGQIKMINDGAFAGIRTVFEELIDDDRGFINENESLSEVLAQGIEMELQSVELYRNLADQSPDPDARTLWHALRAEEKKHLRLLELTQEYIDKPKIVLETAEFLFYGHDTSP